MKSFIFSIMIFLHIVDDYYLQGILAKMKQRSWWEENAPDDLYKNDYRVALIIHGFSWSFMVHLPITIPLFLKQPERLSLACFSIVGFGLLHAFIDDLKANKKKISLFIDQALHLLELIGIFTIFYAFHVVGG